MPRSTARRPDYRPAPGSIPTQPGVYRFRDARGRVIYVGKAKNLRARLSSYFQDPIGLHQRTAAMVASRLAGGASSGQSSGASQESSGFKNLKESLNKPSAGSLGGILGTAGGQKKFGAGFGGPKQTWPGAGGGRNQTFGADLSSGCAVRNAPISPAPTMTCRGATISMQ